MTFFEMYLFFMPQYLFIIFLFASIFSLIHIKLQYENIDLNQYFSSHIIPSYSKKSIIDLVFIVLDIVYKVIVFFVIIIFLVIFIYYFPEAREYINISSKFIQDETFQWVTLMITLSAILVAFKKEYYLVFSIDEVLERFKFKNKILYIVTILLINRILFIIKPLYLKYDIVKFGLNFTYLFLYFAALIIGCNLIYRIILLLFSKEQSELDLLDKLYYKTRIRTSLYSKSTNIR